MLAVLLLLAALALSYFAANPEPRRLADGVVRYELSGPTHGRVMVLVHGGGLATLDAWTPLMRFLNRRILRYDLFGQGHSDRPRGTYNLDLFDRQLDHLLARLGISEPVDLVGHSMGGLIAATYAARRPERINSLTLLAPAGIETGLHWTVKLVQIPIVGEYLFRMFGRQMAASQYRQHGLKCLEFKGSRRALLSALRNIPWNGADAFARVGGRQFPVLALFGGRDRTVPLSAAAQLARWIPHAEIHQLERATHGLLEDHASVIGELLDAMMSWEEAA
ncbi:MAG TPA: alpha/beta hydrolase [Thermoanaerobaculia bacterium]|nr:alpha/beta hydrolase [Thermoanaerobaculia bacterium]